MDGLEQLTAIQKAAVVRRYSLLTLRMKLGAVGLILMLGPFAFVFLHILVIGSDPITLETFFGAVFSIFGIALPAFMLFSGRPELIMTPRHIILKFPFHKKVWAWKDVGPFSLMTRVSYFEIFREYGAIAYTDETHDAQVIMGQSRPADVLDADIRIPLPAIFCGGSDAAAEGFIKELNQWRDRFGSPEIGIEHREEAERHLNRRFNKMIYGAVAVVIGLHLFAAFLFLTAAE